ncbi:MAG: hypothetical protein HYV41_03100 [Candidatus Magasanikbacteria bacterium]|nr:hypothetical protein [Candidatus Magasanikbacteria bacterium]
MNNRILYFGISLLMGSFLLVAIPVQGAELSTLGASTFLGGTGNEISVKDIFVDIDAVYVFGSTESATLSNAIIAPKRNFNGGSDVFVAKLSLDLKQLLGYTYIGGSDIDTATVFVVKDTNIYIGGYTTSNNLFSGLATSKSSALQGYSDGFFVVLSKNLNFIDGRYWGGSDQDTISGLVVDNQTLYITGETGSSDLLMKNAEYPQYNGGFRDLYFTRFSLATQDVLYSTYIGGTGSDRFSMIQIDSNKNFYIIGDTNSADIPKIVSGNIKKGGQDIVVVKFSPENLHLSTRYVGGNDSEMATNAVVQNSIIYLFGGTMSTDFPVTSGAYQTAHGGFQTGYGIFDQDGFLVTISADLSQIMYGTYLGGWGFDAINDIVIDTSGLVTVSGFTQSFNFPTTLGVYDTSINSASGSGTGDAFITTFSADLKTISVSTLLGGSNYEHVLYLALGKSGGVYVAGLTESADFPVTVSAFDMSYNGGVDMFVSLFDGSVQNTSEDVLPLSGNKPEFFQGTSIDFMLPKVLNEPVNSQFLHLDTNIYVSLAPTLMLESAGKTKLVYGTGGLEPGVYRLRLYKKNDATLLAESEQFTILPQKIVYLLSLASSTVYPNSTATVNVYPGLYAFDKLQNGQFKIQWYNSSGKLITPGLVSIPSKSFTILLPYTFSTANMDTGVYTIQLRDVSQRAQKVLATTKITVVNLRK